MQQYKSLKNLEIDGKLQRKQEQRRGELDFELDSNQSGKIDTTFLKPFPTKPIVIVSEVVEEGPEFSTKVVLTKVTNEGFTVNIENSSVETVKGKVMWCIC